MFHGPKRTLTRVGLAVALVASVMGTALIVSFGVASANSGCGTLAAGGASPPVYINCAVPPSSTPYSSYTDAQQVNLSIGSNSVFSPSDSHGGAIAAIECEYNNGSGGAGDPPNDNFCNAQTAGPDFPFTVQSNGSFDYTTDTGGDTLGLYAQPDSTFPGAAITCNATHACVMYVGEDYTNFTAPHVFSNPFYVGLPAPVISSGTSTSVAVGSNEHFQVVASGSPTFSDTAFSGCTPSTLPSNVTFTGAGLLTGIPVDGSVASYTVCVVANDGTSPNATQSLAFTVTKAPLKITASSPSMAQGGTVPTITAGYLGFVNGDTAAKLTTAPTCSTTATSSSSTGTYPSSCSGAVDPNYTISYVPGSVTVHASFYITTTESAFPSATDGVEYGPVQLEASGGTAPFKWKVTGGALPKKLKVHPTGLLSGKPKSGKHGDASGTYTFTVTVSTHKSKKAPPVQTATATFTITIPAT